jgi:hypothetical protein
MVQIQMVAGSVAGFIFAAASWNMLIKAWRTKDLRSYSLGQIVLNNVGNVFYWVYVISLPIGPIYFMHAFFTLASLLMLIWYFIYGRELKHSPFSQSRKQELEILGDAHALASFPGICKRVFGKVWSKRGHGLL